MGPHQRTPSAVTAGLEKLHMGQNPKSKMTTPLTKTVEILFSVLRAWHDVEAPHAPTNRPLLGVPQCRDIAADCQVQALGEDSSAPTPFTGVHRGAQGLGPWLAVRRDTAVRLTAGGGIPQICCLQAEVPGHITFLLIICLQPPCCASLFSFF